MSDDVPPHACAALAAELRILTRRRIVFATLVGASIVLGLAALLQVLGADGLSPVDIILTCLFGLTLPWLVIGWWNALIGFVIDLVARDPAAMICPAVGRASPTAPIRSQTAILVPARNEDPASLFSHLAAISANLEATDMAEQVSIFLLSDTSDPGLAAEEEERFCAWQATARLPYRLHYRRRLRNEGHKMGNLWEFLERRGAEFEFALILDADSLMSGEAIARLVRIMEASPEIGILQHLTVGLPTAAPFARLFQTGMRQGMRTYSLGSAWWQGDCGPYWGHNALVRLKPFMAHCRLLELPGAPPWGGRILSHDQVEAVLMREAGWQVRLLALEDGSFERNPPTLTEFIRRDLRWGQGNLQYLNLLPRLTASPMARLQLVLASLMYLTAPAWMAFMLITIGRTAVAGLGAGGAGQSLGTDALSDILTSPEPWRPLSLLFCLAFAPKLAGTLATCLDSARAKAFGGRARLAASTLLEIIFSVLLAPVMLVAQTRLVLAMACGRTVAWEPQHRAHRSLRWSTALRGFWLEMTLGACLIAAAHIAAPQLWAWAWLLGGPLSLTPLFAVVTASPALGRLLVRAKIACAPEELAPPAIVELAGHAVAAERRAPGKLRGERPAALAREAG